MAMPGRLLAALAFLLAPAAARADERILKFVSDVQIQQDSSIAVAETIDVHAENEQINHGIYRDFPTRYRGPHGRRVRIGFTLDGATLDGQPVKTSTEAIGNGVRIKLGDAATTVSVGDHRYVIRYHATREIGRFKDYDELYWNATGNGWVFPIDEAEARIRLPQLAGFGQRAAYTGSQGSTASDAVVAGEGSGEIVFRTTRSLEPYEGLTVAVAFPKGVVADSSASDRTAQWIEDYAPRLIGLLGLGGLLFYLWTAWRRVGRDPRAGTVVPLFSPPDGLTPAAMRYIQKMSFDNRAFAATLVDLGVRGHLRLIEEDGGWLGGSKRSIERLASTNPLSEGEKAMLDALVEPGKAIAMEQSNNAAFRSANSALSAHLKGLYEDKMFHRNIGWALAGVALLVVALWLSAGAVLIGAGASQLLPVVASSAAMTLGAAALFWWAGHSSAVGKCLGGGIGALLAVAAFPLGGTVIMTAFAFGDYLPLLLPLLAAPLVIASFWWISAPTDVGRAALDRIAGFKQYLSIAEGQRLDRMTSDEATVGTFEKYLPFAIALGVENQWADRFRSVLAAAATQGQGQYFGWYSGSSSPWTDVGGFTRDIGSSLASTVSSASTAPGSSSGSGGGGSSGGGGGGGGGGGW